MWFVLCRNNTQCIEHVLLAGGGGGGGGRDLNNWGRRVLGQFSNVQSVRTNISINQQEGDAISVGDFVKQPVNYLRTSLQYHLQRVNTGLCL